MHTSCLENLEGGYHLKDLDVDGRIILDWILGNIVMKIQVPL